MITLLGRLGVTCLLNPKETLRTLALCPQTPLGSDLVTLRESLGWGGLRQRRGAGNLSSYQAWVQSAVQPWGKALNLSGRLSPGVKCKWGILT